MIRVIIREGASRIKPKRASSLNRAGVGHRPCRVARFRHLLPNQQTEIDATQCFEKNLRGDFPQCWLQCCHFGTPACSGYLMVQLITREDRSPGSISQTPERALFVLDYPSVMSRKSASILGVRLAEFEQFRQRIHEMFATLRSSTLDSIDTLGQWSPAIDVCDAETQVIIWVELPGIDPRDVQVTYANGHIRIRGEKREQEHSGHPVCYFCLERTYGSFSRTLRLDWALDINRAEAALTNGVLTIKLPKILDRRSREIAIPVQEGE